MLKIDKDEDEYDEDGNLIPQDNQIKPGELNSLGMPIFKPNVPLAPLPPGIPGTPAQYAPHINIQNIPLSSMPSNVSIPAAVIAAASERPKRQVPTPRGPTPEPVPESGGYLDPETGMWVEEKKEEPERRSSRGREKEREREKESKEKEKHRERERKRSDGDSRSRERSSRSSDKNTVTPLKISLKSDKNTQESPRVPKLTINIGNRSSTTEHAFFQDLDKTSRERDERRKQKHHKTHKEKHKHKKKKKKKYQSDDEEDSDSESDIECLN